MWWFDKNVWFNRTNKRCTSYFTLHYIETTWWSVWSDTRNINGASSDGAGTPSQVERVNASLQRHIPSYMNVCIQLIHRKVLSVFFYVYLPQFHKTMEWKWGGKNTGIRIYEEYPWSEEEEENQKDEDKEPRAEMKRSANKQTHAKLSIGSGALSFPRLEWFEARFKSKGFTCIKDDKQNYLG